MQLLYKEEGCIGHIPGMVLLQQQPDPLSRGGLSRRYESTARFYAGRAVAYRETVARHA